MGIDEKDFVLEVVRAHLQASAPGRLPELEKDFGSLYAAAQERERVLRESGSSQGHGLPFDASFGAGVFVGTILWAAFRMVQEALAADSPRDLKTRLERAERLLCEETGRFEMVIEIRQIVLSLAERMDGIERGLRGLEPQAQGLAVSSSSHTSILRLVVRREGPAKLVFEAQSELLGFHNKDLGSLTLEGDPKAQAQEELGRRVDDLSDLALAGERGQESARHQLADMAVALFRKLPQGVRDLLWSQVGRIETLQILSDEPYIPWELLKLQDDNGQAGPYLCEAFQVTRWLRDFPQTVSTLPLRSIAVVLTTDSNLPSAEKEKADLIALLGAERLNEIEPSFSEVKKALLGGDYDGWHFAGHGSAARVQDPNRTAIELRSGEFLTPESLGTAKANLSRLRPLIFLNGCDTGRGGFSLSGLGGWAQQSLEAGAGAFIGTLWPVRDKKARAFAQAFYQLFLGGEPIAEAVRQARLQVRDQFPGDPAWLAYTVYAHPGAIWSRTAVKPAEQRAPSLLRLPELTWNSESSSPGQLLQAEFGVVPFHGRKREEDDLCAWCMEEGLPVRVRLYTGPGGMGKTRFALEIAKRLRQEGWLAGFIELGSKPSAEELWKEISRPGGKALAIVDYAETRRDLLVPLFRRLHAASTGPIRLILLARAALDWWEQLKTEEKGVGALLSGPATTRHSLQPLALGLQERAESYHLAGKSFADKLSKQPPAEVPEGLEADFYERALLLHMAAYVELQGKEAAKSENNILDVMLQHERRYWKRRAVDDKKLAESLVRGISRAMAVVTLVGGVDSETGAFEILRQLQAFKGHTGDVLLEVAHLLHECYPGNRWIEPILPDLLGEHLVQREMERGADELLNLVVGPSSADGGAFDDPRS